MPKPKQTSRSNDEKRAKAATGKARIPIGVTRNNLVRTTSAFSPQQVVALALSDLSADGYAQAASTHSTLQNSEELLNSLGFMLVQQEKLYGEDNDSVEFSKDFSLAKTINVDSTIENNRIVDPDLSDLTPGPLSATDKFKSATDSFYDLDDEKTDNIKLMEREHKNRERKKLFKISQLIVNITRHTNNRMLKRQPNKAKLRR